MVEAQARFFLLVDLRDFFSDYEEKKSSENDQFTVFFSTALLINA